eukprot:CAMPEP_0194171536 /NCGR_PEP_ID=MMETSP0154-20130528/6094_1 /TAXON_ID=1049557 /ORGANISM="Thalassiothrix antarctica, Strain L6-D1" /LENGTH=805 /DNA_ID=CAMNT_0038883869 /DNA_START=11 /DNA_END=2428 /DNA_ORIENTATION=-
MIISRRLFLLLILSCRTISSFHAVRSNHYPLVNNKEKKLDYWNNHRKRSDDGTKTLLTATKLDDIGDVISSSMGQAFQELMTRVSDLLPSNSQDLMTRVSDLLPSNPVVLYLLTTFLTYLVISSVLSPSGESKPYPLNRYDADAANRYFNRRLPTAMRRALEIFITSLGFGLSILMDSLRNEVDDNADKRGLELAMLLTKLGPTFIKVGQTLSIRTDLLSPAYIRGLQTLQDQVPPFETEIAREILEEAWGVTSIDSVVDGISVDTSPVAAASLGQVYKARLKETGQDIAIKVQRPNIEEQVALDMYLLRTLGTVLKLFANLNSDAAGTVDAWGVGFVDELNYLEEAQNAQIFMEGISTTPLKEVVFAPKVVSNLSTRKVLTTEWVDGERLDRSNKDDITILCSIAMNTYLTMMLEIGTLHCDPHPGNLLRTPDGRLCILDWGMVTRLDNDLQISLIEHMAHLTSGDYDEIPRDLLLLDFIPESKANMIQDSGVVETLTDVYSAFITGGRVAAPVNEVVAKLAEMSSSKGNIFKIPPYFAYIAKSFSVLEGIGLGINQEYSIIAECLPYTSKRLLTDINQRTGVALSSFVFGPDKYDLQNRVVEYDRVEQLVTGFGSYTTSASGELLGSGSSTNATTLTQTETLERYADQVLDLVFAEEETPLQSILLEQLAKIFTSHSRSMWTQLKDASWTLPNGRSVLDTAVDPFGLFRYSSLLNMNSKDEQIVTTTRKLITLAQQQINGDSSLDDASTNISNEDSLRLASIITRKVWDRRSAVLETGNRFANQVLNVTITRLEQSDNLVPTQ